MRLFDIVRNSYVDGPGIRTTVFFKGCNLRCRWCHNPESQSMEKQLLFYRNKCTGCGKCEEKCKTGGITDPNSCEKCGECALYCPADARKLCGKDRSEDEVMAVLRKDAAFYARSGGGVTFSGGECLLQPDALAGLLHRCHGEGIHTAVDTAGCVDYSVFQRIFADTDLFLYDLKAFDPDVHTRLTGQSSERILDNYRRLLQDGARVWVRIPVIGGANVEEIPKIAAFLREYPPEKAELLPYHSLGEGKYDALGWEREPFSVPDAETMERLRRLLP